MSDPKELHLVAAKRILRYLRGTMNYGVWFLASSTQKENELLGWSDADYGGEDEEIKSTTDYHFRSTIGYFFRFLGAPIPWCSKLQPVVALSSCESEYIAGCYAACQAKWLRSVWEEIKLQVKIPMKLMVNKSATCSSKEQCSSFTNPLLTCSLK